ncbi:DUF402 domain-containing protein [Streptomyces sp. NPDC050703]|uniref:DUF402 domain-containing protein n=1 Tax=Streptomyces sp. NPDC050703 TaxID=3157218 RepID=UPI003447A298
MWQETELLLWKPPTAWFSINAFFTAAGLRNWYVNFEHPTRRSEAGFDTFDLTVDLVIDPDLTSWQWKDEDEYAHALRTPGPLGRCPYASRVDHCSGSQITIGLHRAGCRRPGSASPPHRPRQAAGLRRRPQPFSPCARAWAGRTPNYQEVRPSCALSRKTTRSGPRVLPYVRGPAATRLPTTGRQFDGGASRRDVQSRSCTRSSSIGSPCASVRCP